MNFYLLLLSILAFLHASTAFYCYSCASTIFLTQWDATGFPYKPASDDSNFAYTDLCMSGTMSKYQQRCSGNTCVEATYLIDGQYAIVRGCHDHLMGNDPHKLSNVNSTCYSYNTRKSAIVDSQGTKVDNVYVAIHYCVLDTCNGDLDENAATSTNYENGKKYDVCTEPTKMIECYQCSYFLDGTCKKDQGSCEGAWCTKTEGKINGEKIVTRGCAHFNPTSIQDEFCIENKQDLRINQVGSPITLSFNTDQCYCKSQHCNGVGSTVVSIGAIVISLIFLAV